MARRRAADKTAENPATSLETIDPLLSRFLAWGEKLSMGSKLAFCLAPLVITGVVAAVFALMTVPSFVEAIVGVPLGAWLFLSGLLAGKWYRKDKPPLKERLTFSQRIRWTLVMTTVVVLIAVTVQGRIPFILGGVLVLAAVLGIYNFFRRTPQELEFAAAGEVDPREVQEAEEIVEVEDEEVEEYINVLKSLPEEQQRVLLNPKMNQAIAVLDDTDKKKRRNPFGRKKKS